MTSPRVSKRHRFGPFILDSGEGSLTRNGYRVKLQELPFRLLVMLVERSNEIISREEMRSHLWPENTFVEFDNSLGVAIRKIRSALGDDTDAPRYLETVPRRGYRFIAPVNLVEVDPSIGQAVSIGQAMSTEKPPVQPHVLPSPKAASLAGQNSASSSGFRRYAAIGGLICVFAGAGAYVFKTLSSPTAKAASPAVSSPVSIRRSIAVLGFRNLPARTEDNWLSSAFSEMLSTELGSSGKVRLVAGEDVARIKRELPVTEEDSLGKETLAHLKVDPGADFVVLGSYTAIPDAKEKRIRLDLRVQDTLRGETVAQESFTGDQTNLFDLVSSAGKAIRRSLAISSESNSEVEQARAAMPSNAEGIRYYVNGRQRLWAFDTVLARELFEKAVAADPAFPLGHAALADAWLRLGYIQKARAEAERARALAGGLGEEERLVVEALYYSTLYDRAQTITTYKELYSRYPDNLDYGLRLAGEQRWLSVDDALRTLQALRKLPAPSGTDPRIDLEEARTWIMRDVSRAQSAANRGLAAAKAGGSPLLVARAYGILCQMQSSSAPFAETVRNCEGARDTARAAGNIDGIARASNDLAGAYFSQGRFDDAEKGFREALAIFKQTGDLDGISAAANNLGAISLLKGNAHEAMAAFNETLPGYRERGDEDGIALAMNNLGDASFSIGDLKGALSHYQQAEAVAMEIDDKSALGYIYTGEGNVHLEQNELKNAEDLYGKALALRKASGEKQFAGETDVRRAHLLIAEGKAPEAEAILRARKSEFEVNNEADDQLEASLELAESLALQGRIVEAKQELDQASRLAAKSSNAVSRIRLQLVASQTEGRAGNLRAARSHLESAIRAASTHQLAGLELEGQLRLAMLKSGSGSSAKDHAEIAALEAKAHRQGFELIALRTRSLESTAR